MERKLFCEISPFTYRLSMEKEILKRHVQDMLRKTRFARERTQESLPVVVYRHNSLIRRRLGNVDMQLQGFPTSAGRSPSAPAPASPTTTSTTASAMIFHHKSGTMYAGSMMVS
jgi:hypothetical protein